MATKNFTGMPKRADHMGDTAPLPPAAEAALSRLERAVAGRSTADVLAHEAGSYVRPAPEVQRAVTRYGNLMARVAELSMRARLTPAQYNHLADAQAELNRLHEQLEQAGQLHLVVA